MMDELAAYFTVYATKIFFAASFVCVLELLFPRSRNSMESRIRGAVFWIAYILITASGYIAVQHLLRDIGITPLFVLDFNTLGEFLPFTILVSLIASWATIQIGEFFYYWFHRAQHAIPFLWRFHETHHSIREMSAFNSNHHFTEELLRIPLVLLPLSFLFAFKQPEATLLWSLFIGAQGVFEHSSTRINWGWFRYVIPDNCFHRIHHSREKKHFDKNFGSASAIWDLLFGTIYRPARDEWPDVGLSYMDEPRSLQDFLFRPFYRKRKKTAAIKSANQSSSSAAP